jgi:hypothetical protein
VWQWALHAEIKSRLRRSIARRDYLNVLVTRRCVGQHLVMAVHQTLTSMLRESLPEYVAASRLLLDARKPDGGCLGYPAAVLLFAIVDAIGSYHEGSNEIFLVDGQNLKIKGTSTHIRILNGPLFDLHLTKPQLELVYDAGRCFLAHNALVAPSAGLMLEGDVPFTFTSERAFVHLDALWKLCERAVAEFLATRADALMPKSNVFANLKKAGDPVPPQTHMRYLLAGRGRCLRLVRRAFPTQQRQFPSVVRARALQKRSPSRRSSDAKHLPDRVRCSRMRR